MNPLPSDVHPDMPVLFVFLRYKFAKFEHFRIHVAIPPTTSKISVLHCSSGDPCMKMGTYCKTEGIIGLMIKELLPKVSRFRCKRNECAINHTKTGSPGMTGHALHPV